jgi:integrase
MPHRAPLPQVNKVILHVSQHLSGVDPRARLREILHLRWENIDFERNMLLLPDSKTGKKAIVLNAPRTGPAARKPSTLP